jgi:transcriptional regulator with XRE-family HTH domain
MDEIEPFPEMAPGARLKKWRLERGLKAADVAAKIESTRQAVSRYESGRRPKQPYLDRITVMTDGEVTGSDWQGKEAAHVVARRQASA